jgi:hypothetical protein
MDDYETHELVVVLPPSELWEDGVVDEIFP